MAHTKLNTFHLFAGAGGGILGDLLLGHNPIGACEIEPYPRDVLLARQRDGILPSFPIWDDVATLDGNPWRGTVDVLCGGFPCQDISAAGKGAGITGERSGLWKEYARLIGEMRPRFVFAENSPLLRTRGLGVVLEDLAALGYNARWGIIGARDVGAPHKRDRMWVLAYSNNDGNPAPEESQSTTQGSDSGQTRPQPTSELEGLCASRADGSMAGLSENLADAPSIGQQGQGLHGRSFYQAEDKDWKANWTIDPGEGYETERDTIARLDRVVNGVAFTMDKHGKVVNDSSHGNKLITETRSESDETCQELQPMLNIRGEAASPPQGQGQVEQRPKQLAEAMPEMPCGDSCESWGLGAWKNEIETNGVQDLRHVIHSDSLSLNQKQFIVWLAAMRGREWAAECFKAMGQTPRVALGAKDRVNRLKAIGNGQVPQCAAVAFSILSEGLI